jgi:hypothetical protein
MPIESAAGIVRQDRANYHKFDERDKGDRHDLTFDSKKERAWLSKALQESLDDATKKTIRKRQPVVQVVVWDDRAELTIIEKGPKHAMSWSEADTLCKRRYCKCLKGKGKCKSGRYIKCMESRGHSDNGHGCGRGL